MASEHVRWRPAQVLRRFAAWYTGYDQTGLPPVRHRGLPSPYLTLIITLREPLRVAVHPDPAAAPGDYRTLVGGLHTTPAIITHDGSWAGIQIALSPLGARALLGRPAGELAGVDVDGAAVLGPLAAELHERAALASGWAARFRIVDELLTARALANGPDLLPAPEVVHAWRRLCASSGAVGPVELAAETGWSQRYLGRRRRLLRPGPPDPRVHGAGRRAPGPVVGGGVRHLGAFRNVQSGPARRGAASGP
jgi:hypothetical protein